MLKQLFDYLIAFLLMNLFFPVILLISAINFLLYFKNPFFVQERIGKNGKSFFIIKFRTMKNANSKDWDPKEDISRLTFFGGILRKYSLDEVPQLINVLLGNMSLVGPRPLPMEYLPLFNDVQNSRHWVKPGITGWAQINGRNSISWEERFEMDVWYVKNYSFKLDMIILFKTFMHLFRKKGINKSSDLTMDKFTGTKN